MEITSPPPITLSPSPVPAAEPGRDCPLCPRLVAVREELRIAHPGWWNAPVPALGEPSARIVIVGLAPGKHGANRTGRPFTGDDAGTMLFATLAQFGLSTGHDSAGGAAEAQLIDCVIMNAVKCLPPQNKPLPAEAHSCRRFLEAGIAALPQARIFIALGQVAHQSTVKALGGRLPKARFAHLAEHRLPGGHVLIDSYHCSRYNQNTGRLTTEMFEAVFARALELRSAL
jgi:uracil-DNA glycosylase